MDMMRTMQNEMFELKTQLKPVNKFFNNLEKKPAPTKMSRAEKEALEDERMEAAIAAKALKKLAKKGLL